MIRLLLVGCARLLFQTAVVALLVGGLLLYASYRLVRSSVARDRGQPTQAAAFAVLVSLAGLARAVRDRLPEAPAG